MSGYQVTLAFSFDRLTESIDYQDIFVLFESAIRDHFIARYGDLESFESEIIKYDDLDLDQFELRNFYIHVGKRYLAFGASIKEVYNCGSMFYFWDESKAATEEMYEEGKSMMKSLCRAWKGKIEIQKFVCVSDYGNAEIEEVLFNSNWTEGVVYRIEEGVCERPA